MGPKPQSARRRRWWLAAWGFLVVVGAVAGGYGWFVARNGASRSPVRVPRLLPTAMTVAPGVYMLGGLSPSAAYVVETSDGLILIDSGLAPDAAPLKAQMAKLGLDWRKVRAILLTHAHGDHTGGAEALRTSTGAKVYAGQGDAGVLRAGQPREAFFSTFFMPGVTPRSTSIDVPLKGDETIRLGDVHIRALATPGHTPGSICYLMERDGLRVLFAGDVIMMLQGDDPPRNEQGKPLGTYSAYLSPRYRGDARTFLSSLRRLRALPVPDLVLPGHPVADPTPQRPQLSQECWQSLLDRGIRDMEILLTRYEQDGADFLDNHPKQLLPDLYYLGDFQGAAVYGFFASSKFCLVDAPGGAGLAGFVRDALAHLGLKTTTPAAVWLTSCGMSETSGLNELVETYHLQVVAPRAGLETIRSACPAGTEFVAAEELAGRDGSLVTVIPLRGRGFSPVAYRLTWTGKNVLISGKIPIQRNQRAAEALITDLTSPPGSLRDYRASLNELRSPKPDLWLPAVAVDEQNANLYGKEWDQVIEDNLFVLKHVPSQ